MGDADTLRRTPRNFATTYRFHHKQLRLTGLSALLPRHPRYSWQLRGGEYVENDCEKNETRQFRHGVSTAPPLPPAHWAVPEWRELYQITMILISTKSTSTNAARPLPAMLWAQRGCACIATLRPIAMTASPRRQIAMPAPPITTGPCAIPSTAIAGRATRLTTAISG